MFIRTKNGIYDITNWKQDRYCHYDENSRLQDNVYATLVSKADIIKQADTIIELCDGLIDTDTHFPKIERDNLWEVDELENLQINYEVWNENEKGRYNVYGFIQTDKGLIFVAKMNEKGELDGI